nr:MsnO8 family LLM class oxidoreductase [Nocardia altamirensis]
MGSSHVQANDQCVTLPVRTARGRIVGTPSQGRSQVRRLEICRVNPALPKGVATSEESHDRRSAVRAGSRTGAVRPHGGCWACCHHRVGAAHRGDGISPVLGRGIGDEPEVWLLGSSGYSAQVAAALGLRFAFAHHFSAANTEPALALYRENFQPSEHLARPHAMIAVAAVVADTDEQADILAMPRELAFLQLAAGRPQALPTPEQAAAFPLGARERHFIEQRREGQLLGSPATVRQQLDDLVARTQPDEIMLNTLVYDLEDRIRSFELFKEKVIAA